MIVCSCNVMSDRQIKGCIDGSGSGPRTPAQVYAHFGCKPDCGRCAPTIRTILANARAACDHQCDSCAKADRLCAVHVALPPAATHPMAVNDREAA
jgi:bacterioferritin-associated ferredoxin